jgi:FkbM family methyltransferase
MSLIGRLKRIGRFASEAISLSAIPELVIAAIARDSPFGSSNMLSRQLGRWYQIVKVRTRSTSGEVALIDTHDLGNLVSCEEVLIEQTYDLMMVPFRPDLIVDCGAHIGLFSLVAGLKYPSADLIAFEPDADNFRLAQEQLGRFASRVTLIEAAVSTSSGQSWFSRGASNSRYITDRSDERQRRVQVIDLAEEASRWRGRRLLLKIDIEGTEREVLPHVIDHLPRQCAIFFEVHGGQEIWDAITTIVSRAGFHVAITRDRDSFKDGFALRA